MGGAVGLEPSACPLKQYKVVMAPAGVILKTVPSEYVLDTMLLLLI
jgi:hypothetical protein